MFIGIHKLIKGMIMTDVDKLQERRKNILAEIAEIAEIAEAPLWVNGSVIESTRKANGKEYPFNYLSQSIGGKTQTTYISAKQLDEFKKAVEEGLKVKKLIAELGNINIKLLKGGQ